MRLLLDECLPRKLKPLFGEHGYECLTIREAGFAGKENGELLALAEGQFDVLITIDKNIHYQQNIRGRNIAILIMRAPSNAIDDLRPRVPAALEALWSIQHVRLSRLEFSSTTDWNV
jgi:predicted nuclease of predicted toxin-antitoxin system